MVERPGAFEEVALATSAVVSYRTSTVLTTTRAGDRGSR
jgi:hypothetical protein